MSFATIHFFRFLFGWLPGFRWLRTQKRKPQEIFGPVLADELCNRQLQGMEPISDTESIRKFSGAVPLSRTAGNYPLNDCDNSERLRLRRKRDAKRARQRRAKRRLK